MREVKKHWRKGQSVTWKFLVGSVAVCGAVNPNKYANKKSAVTCRNCARILAGYKGEKRV